MDQQELNSKLLEAAENGDTDTMWKLVEQGAKINTRDEDGRTALIWAAYIGHLTPELLDVFMTYGADVNARDEDGNTALMYVAESGQLTPELLKAFNNHGADVNAQDKDGRTALMKSAWYAYYGSLTPELLEAFASNGADMNAQDKYGWTVLMLLARSGSLTPELMEAFAANGADINARDKDGNNAMFLCLKGQYTSGMVRSILSFFSCGYSIRNMYDGWTPENFIERLSGNADLNAEQRAAFAMLAAISLYPERSESLDTYVSKKRSAAADLIIPCLKDVSPAIMENFLRMMSEGRTSALSLSKKSVGALAGILVGTMETSPGAAVEFVKKRVGKNIEVWVNDGVEGADILVSRLVPYIKDKNNITGNVAPDTVEIECF